MSYSSNPNVARWLAKNAATYPPGLWEKFITQTTIPNLTAYYEHRHLMPPDMAERTFLVLTRRRLTE